MQAVCTFHRTMPETDDWSNMSNTTRSVKTVFRPKGHWTDYFSR